jgi:hypothetical protein
MVPQELSSSASAATCVSFAAEHYKLICSVPCMRAPRIEEVGSTADNEAVLLITMWARNSHTALKR